MPNREGDRPRLQSRKVFPARHIPEPLLIFGSGETHIDPKIGLTLHGPLAISDSDQPTPTSINVGIVGTGETVDSATKFLEWLMDEVPGSEERPFLYPGYPGFEKIFRCEIMLREGFNEIVTRVEVATALKHDTFSKTVSNAAQLFLDKIESMSEKTPKPDVALCALPQDIIDKCAVQKTKSGEALRPKSSLVETLKTHVANKQTFLDSFEDEALKLIESDSQEIDNFWRAVKAGSMKFGMPTQIVWPSTLDITSKSPSRQHNSVIAWNFAVALHYKGSGYPWTMTRMKSGTCYVGISFFKDGTGENSSMRTSLAQIFTFKGEGLVIRGDRFEWDDKKDRSPHLDKDGAEKILKKAIDLYTDRIGQLPERVVVHKSSKYWQGEKEGFQNALKGIKFSDMVSFAERDIRFFRYGQFPPLRGTVVELGKRNYLLYTRGYSPYLKTYPGLHIPAPLEILEHFGESPAGVILTEILALSKMNWNSADFSLAKPITLVFSKRVGEVMATLPDDVLPRHQYLFYM